MNQPRRPKATGRGAQISPANRFETQHRVDDFEHLPDDDEFFAGPRRLPTEYLPDDSKSIVSENESPDVLFRYSLNPYRGCAHGCPYCYARITHEYLGMDAGLEFETKILVKHRAAELFRDWLARENWQPEMIAFSGVTDCYQPAERDFKLTRRCLEVAAEARQPIGIITKNALVVRDVDVLRDMSDHKVVSVGISLTTLDASLAKVMEPRTSTPAARLRAIETLRTSGVPVHLMVAPVIPGLNDSEIPSILRAAADAGACSFSYVLLRLPLNVRPIFLDWLERNRPADKDRVVSRIRATRGGELSDSKFGRRMRGEGQIADQIRQTFAVFGKQLGLLDRMPPLDTSAFRRPTPSSGQMRLF